MNTRVPEDGSACRLLAVLVATTLLTACGSTLGVRPGSDERFVATAPPEVPVTPAVAAATEWNQGAIFQRGTAVSLFEDYKARRVGDVLSVVLDERTNARKSNNASTSKESSVELANPTLFGREVTRNGVPILGGSVSGSRDFDGEGEAAQSNLLEGTITVTVADVLSNGNLVVQGEKWVRINQGEEYIRLRGIVRPVDIRADNTVFSTQIADAQVAYGGTGTLAHSSAPGWLTRFFNAPIWPF